MSFSWRVNVSYLPYDCPATCECLELFQFLAKSENDNEKDHPKGPLQEVVRDENDKYILYITNTSIEKWITL